MAHGEVVGGLSGPIGVAHVCVVVRACVPLVGPYGAVDAISPGGHGAGALSGVETSAHIGAHAYSGVHAVQLVQSTAPPPEQYGLRWLVCGALARYWAGPSVEISSPLAQTNVCDRVWPGGKPLVQPFAPSALVVIP